MDNDTNGYEKTKWTKIALVLHAVEYLLNIDAKGFERKELGLTKIESQEHLEMRQWSGGSYSPVL